ncbi:hypothetical protein [Burkholderia sp. WP9]|uniref:hypothetical protein n=1 Tax=Burkholderia sp. WP9 TaxID=1500263 RepID=UPI000B87C567|nr:hypothetical protein [Burkholderia sp. WP9]
MIIIETRPTTQAGRVFLSPLENDLSALYTGQGIRPNVSKRRSFDVCDKTERNRNILRRRRHGNRERRCRIDAGEVKFEADENALATR